jgi:microcompartment protein CcmK/EutM
MEPNVAGRAVSLFVALRVDAGIGERVLLTTEGFSTRTAVGHPNSPVDAAVIGVIDAVDLHIKLFMWSR